MKSFLQHLNEGAVSHAENYAASRRHQHRLEMDPEYKKAVQTGTSAGRLPIRIPVSPVTAARAGGIPGIPEITGYVQHRDIDTEQAKRLGYAGAYYNADLVNQPLNRMNLSSFSAESGSFIPHERRHAVQTGGAQVNAAIKAASVPGTPGNEQLKTYQANPSEENKQNFLDALDLTKQQPTATKAFSKFVSTITGYRYGPDTKRHINSIMALPHQTQEADKDTPMYSFEPWEVDSRVQDSIHHIVKNAPTDAAQFAESFGVDHLHHLDQFNKTGDVTHLKNFETHVRNTAISAGIGYNDNHHYLKHAEDYFDKLTDHIGSGEMLRFMSNPPTDVEAWKKNSLKALETFREQHRQHVERANRDTMGAAGLILTRGTNLGGKLLRQYEHLIAPEHQERFQQYIDQTFNSMDPKLSLYKEPATS